MVRCVYISCYGRRAETVPQLVNGIGAGGYQVRTPKDIAMVIDSSSPVWLMQSVALASKRRRDLPVLEEIRVGATKEEPGVRIKKFSFRIIYAENTTIV